MLSRRSRRVVSEPLPWEPTLKDPLVGNVVWPIPDNKEITITLFKNQRTNEFEDKDWSFILEDVSNGLEDIILPKLHWVFLLYAFIFAGGRKWEKTPSCLCKC